MRLFLLGADVRGCSCEVLSPRRTTQDMGTEPDQPAKAGASDPLQEAAWPCLALSCLGTRHIVFGRRLATAPFSRLFLLAAALRSYFNSWGVAGGEGGIPIQLKAGLTLPGRDRTPMSPHALPVGVRGAEVSHVSGLGPCMDRKGVLSRPWGFPLLASPFPAQNHSTRCLGGSVG